MNTVIWHKEEPGWYTSELGGICIEEDGTWWWYPKDTATAFGPFLTLGQAKEAAERKVTE